MAFEPYSDVILTRDIGERGLRAGDVGTLVDRHAVPGVAEEGYSVEFFDMTGKTVAVVTVPARSPRRTSRSRGGTPMRVTPDPDFAMQQHWPGDRSTSCEPPDVAPL